MRILSIILFIILFIPFNASAYIGPGLGIGTLGVILGVLFSIILAIFAIVWYPFKRIINKFRNKIQQ